MTGDAATYCMQLSQRESRGGTSGGSGILSRPQSTGGKEEWTLTHAENGAFKVQAFEYAAQWPL